MMASMIRVILPQHLQVLASVPREVSLQVNGTVTQRSILDALESAHPLLRGAIREHVTLKRRPLVRFFVCEEDISLDPIDEPLPESLQNGTEVFYIIGAIAGG